MKLKVQKGFTLIELAIVGLFLGLLAIFAITQFSGSATDTTRANSVYEASGKISENWALLTMQCGTSSDIGALDFTSAKGASTTADSAVGGTVSNHNLAVLLGASTVHADWSGCMASSGVKTLGGLAKGDTTNGFSIYDYAIALGKGATAKDIKVQFSSVPDSVVLALYNKLSSASGAATATALPASDTSDPTVQFSTASAATRTLTIIRHI